jgi:hypothetical protein
MTVMHSSTGASIDVSMRHSAGGGAGGGGEVGGGGEGASYTSAKIPLGLTKLDTEVPRAAEAAAVSPEAKARAVVAARAFVWEPNDMVAVTTTEPAATSSETCEVALCLSVCVCVCVHDGPP